MNIIIANSLTILGPNLLRTSAGRYHRKGAVALYLTDTPEFIIKEARCSHFGQQQYEIDFAGIRIADVCNLVDDANALAIAFDIGERGETSAGYNVTSELISRGRDEYGLCQLLAKMLQDRNWDGVMVPGVLGEEGNTYRNLCIFEPKGLEWEDWVVGSYNEVGGTA